MLGDKYHVAGIRRLDGLNPLARVKTIRVDLVARRGPVITFVALVNVGCPVEEQAYAGLVPRDLLRCGHGNISGRLGRAASECGNEESGSGNRDFHNVVDEVSLPEVIFGKFEEPKPVQCCFCAAI